MAAAHAAVLGPRGGSARGGLCWAGCSGKRLPGERICGSHDARAAFTSHVGGPANDGQDRGWLDSPSAANHALAVPAEHSTRSLIPSAPSCCREDHSPSTARPRTAELLVWIDGQCRPARRNPAGCLLRQRPSDPSHGFRRALGL